MKITLLFLFEIELNPHPKTDSKGLTTQIILENKEELLKIDFKNLLCSAKGSAKRRHIALDQQSHGDSYVT